MATNERVLHEAMVWGSRLIYIGLPTLLIWITPFISYDSSPDNGDDSLPCCTSVFAFGILIAWLRSEQHFEKREKALKKKEAKP